MDGVPAVLICQYPYIGVRKTGYYLLLIDDLLRQRFCHCLDARMDIHLIVYIAQVGTQRTGGDAQFHRDRCIVFSLYHLAQDVQFTRRQTVIRVAIAESPRCQLFAPPRRSARPRRALHYGSPWAARPALHPSARTRARPHAARR